MKIDFSSQLLDFDGSPVTESGIPMTLGRACLLALSSGANEDKSPKAVMDIYEIGSRIASASSEVEITPEESMLLRAIVAKAMVNPLLSGQVCKALNG